MSTSTHQPSKVTVDPAQRSITRRAVASVSQDYTTLLSVASVAVLAYMYTCKLLLFRHLEYFGSDLFSFLQMTRSWLTDGIILYDNVYGYHAAIHNYYVLLALYPLTAVLGAYGLIVGLFLAACGAAVGIARSTVLPLATRCALLAGLLSPIMYWTLDHPVWGFHPELLYPYLAVIFAVALTERRARLVFASAVTICLVKEDGAVLCASLLISYFMVRMLSTENEPAQRRVLLKRLAAGLGICVAVFVVGMIILHAVRYLVPNNNGQLLSSARIEEALRIAFATLTGTGNPEWGERLRHGMLIYSLIALSLGLLLGRRLFSYLVVAVLGAAPLLLVIAISSAPYGFGNLLWPPRIATLMASLLGTLVVVGWGSHGRPPGLEPGLAARSRRLRLAALVGLVGASWALQISILRAEVDYPIHSRLNLPALISGDGLRSQSLRPDELQFARCLANQLPAGLPILSHGPQNPLFHRQDLRFPGIDSNAFRPPLTSVILGPTDQTLTFPDGFRLSVGRLSISGRPEVEHWVKRCTGNGNP